MHAVPGTVDVAARDALVRLHEVERFTAPSLARGPREGEQEERQRQHLPRCRTQVVDDPVAVGDPVVAEPRGRDDAHVDPRGAERLDPVTHEAPGDVVRVARIRRRQDDDLHLGSSRRAKATGAAIMSSAST